MVVPKCTRMNVRRINVLRRRSKRTDRHYGMFFHFPLHLLHLTDERGGGGKQHGGQDAFTRGTSLGSFLGPAEFADGGGGGLKLTGGRKWQVNDAQAN